MAETDNYYLYTFSRFGAPNQQALASDRLNQVSAQVGDQYRLIDANGDLPDNLLATRTDQQLDIYLDNGVHLVLEGYYAVCTNDQCAIRLDESADLGGFDTSAEQATMGDSVVVHTRGDLSKLLAAHSDQIQAEIVELMIAASQEAANAVSQEPELIEEEDEEDSDSILDWKSLLGIGLGVGALGLAAGSSSGGGDDGDGDGDGDGDENISFSGSTSASVSENLATDETVYTAEATDQDGDSLTYSLSGTDAALFSIEASTGAITFNSAPDHENPGDDDGDNIYELTVTASDGENSAEQAITITVTDVGETDPEVNTATIYDINVSLGPVLDNNTELTVELYNSDNVLLDESFTYDAESGTFVSEDRSNYIGVVEARLVDIGDGLDYLDEATGTPQDVTADLRAFTVVEDGQDSIALNINPLTTISAGVLEFGATAEDILQANQDVAEAFGIDGDLQDHTPVLTIDAEGNNQQANAYGVALALISAYQNASGQTTDEVIDEIIANLDGNSLNDAFMLELIRSATDNPDLQDAFLNQVDEIAFASSDVETLVNENEGLSIETPAYTVEVLGATGVISYSLSGNDAYRFNIDANGVITFNNNYAPDFENPSDTNRDNVYELTVVASDGEHSIDQTISIGITDQNDAPVFELEEDSVSVIENTTSTFYTARAIDQDADSLTYSLSGADAVLFNIDANTGEITFFSPPDYENPAGTNRDNVYELTVVASDSSGDTSEQEVSITVIDTLEVTNIQDGLEDALGSGFSITGTRFDTVRDDAVNEGTEFGTSVSSAGDVNGDGLDDILIGAGFGRYTYVIYSSATDNNQNDVDIDYLNSLDLYNLSASDGLIIDSAQGYMNEREVTTGDINGDGYTDLIFTEAIDLYPGIMNGGTYVIFGGEDFIDTNTSNLIDLRDIANDSSSDQGFVINSDQAGTNWAFSVSSGGDLNGDGIDDLVFGSPFGDRDWDGTDTNDDGNINSVDGDNSGLVYVFFGSTDLGDNVDLTDIENGEGGFVIIGANENDNLGGGTAAGNTLSNAGDVNGDGIDDLIIGVQRADENGDNSGVSYLIFGGTHLGTIDEIDLADIEEGSELGFMINGADASDNAGNSVSSGDINGDGIDDLIISAYRQGSNTGAVYVVFGSTNIGDNIELADIDAGSDQGFAIYGANAGAYTASNVSVVGDMNGDGLDDLAIGVADGDAVYVIYGTTETSNIELSEPEDLDGFVITGGVKLGESVSAAGDVNGDGFDDLIIGDPSDHLSSEGVDSFAYVIFGGSDSSATVGTDGDDLLNGSSGANQIVAGLGDDTLVGNGGADVLRGGAGDDILAISDETFASLDGGNGTDTLRFDAEIELDFTTLNDNLITDIEQIDLIENSVDSDITLDLSDVLNMSSTSNTLTIFGDSGDSVTLDESSNGQSGDWEVSNNDGVNTYSFVADATGSVLASVMIDDTVNTAVI